MINLDAQTLGRALRPVHAPEAAIQILTMPDKSHRQARAVRFGEVRRPADA
jgi:hypothetical protein